METGISFGAGSLTSATINAIIPKKNIGGWTAPKGMEIVGVDTISDALKAMFKDDLKF